MPSLRHHPILVSRRAGLVLVAVALPALAGCGIFGEGSITEPAERPQAAQALTIPSTGASPSTGGGAAVMSPTNRTTGAASRSTRRPATTTATRTATAPTSTRRPAATLSTQRTTTRTPAPRPTTAGGSGSTSSAAEAEVLRLVNVRRAANGCDALTVDATLAAVARAHSKDMAANDYFSHDGRDGRDPFKRMRDAGYAYSWAAENIAAGQGTAASVMGSWMNSPGHRENILNCKLTELGVGVWTDSSSRYGIYWTQDFGTPR
jgi:uncharacterized protein YkwD